MKRKERATCGPPRLAKSAARTSATATRSATARCGSSCRTLRTRTGTDDQFLAFFQIALEHLSDGGGCVVSNARFDANGFERFVGLELPDDCYVGTCSASTWSAFGCWSGCCCCSTSGLIAALTHLTTSADLRTGAALLAACTLG